MRILLLALALLSTPVLAQDLDEETIQKLEEAAREGMIRLRDIKGPNGLSGTDVLKDALARPETLTETLTPEQRKAMEQMSSQLTNSAQ